MAIRGLRHPGEGGGNGGEGADTGKSQPKEIVREMTPDEFWAKHPELKSQFDGGNAAMANEKAAREKKAKEDGEFSTLLETEKKEHEVTRSKHAELAAENKALKRAADIRDHLDTAKDLKFTAAQIKEFAMRIDDGKMPVGDLVKRAIERIEALGFTAAGQTTDNLGGGGSGSGSSEKGADADKRVAELIALGAKARRTQHAQDHRAYNDMKARLRADGIKLPADLATRIASEADKKAA